MGGKWNQKDTHNHGSGSTWEDKIKDDRECLTGSSSEEGTSSIEDHAPEGGWGWIVVIASLFNTFILDGIGSGFGLLYPYILDKFKTTAFVTSFAGSLFVSYMIMGSLAAWLIGRFGIRLVSMVGGVLCCLSMVAASFCDNVYAFILTYGLMAGCSSGLVYLPSIVIVNSYFDQRRGLANGIVSSGAGAGLVVLAPIISWLLEEYALRGTILVLAGVALNMTVFSALFFPVPKSRSVGHVDCSREESQDKNTESENLSALSNDASDKLGRGSVILDKYSIEAQDSHLQEGFQSQRPDTKKSDIVSVNIFEHRPPSSTHLIGKHNIKGKEEFAHLFHQTPWGSDHGLSSLKVRPSLKVAAHHSMDNVAHALHGHTKHLNCSDRTTSASSGHGSLLYLTGSVSTLHNIQNKYLKRSQASSLNTIHGSSQLHPSHLRDHHDSVGEADTEISSQCLTEGEVHLTVNVIESVNNSQRLESQMCDTQLIVDQSQAMNLTLKDLLKKPAFLICCCGACLIQFGYPVVAIFLADYATEQGVSSGQSALVLSVLGGSNIVGRLLAGSLASLGLDPLRLHNVMLSLGALACFLCPFYTSLWSLCVFAALFGFFLGFFPPLQPLIILEHFGLASLGSAFGFLSMMKGLATISGTPIAGWFYDSTKDYSISIAFAGSAILLSVLVHQAMTCFKAS